MRNGAVDEDGGRAKRVPVQMESLWGFWYAAMWGPSRWITLLWFKRESDE